jgi:hypothetical protein
MFGLHLRRSDATPPAAVEAKEPGTLVTKAAAEDLVIEELEPRLVPSVLIYPVELALPVSVGRGQ